jgi:FdrA protein
VINIGLSFFADDLKKQDAEMVNVDWSPPARGNIELANLLAKLSYK